MLNWSANPEPLMLERYSMTALLIGDTERAAIADLKERAQSRVTVVNATTAELMVNVGDEVRAANMAFTIYLPAGYKVTYTLEDQPVGRIEHISISVMRPGKMPNPVAVDMILREFGMRPLADSDSMWIEAFEPRHEAINIAQRQRV
jgi:hypothetical protein